MSTASRDSNYVTTLLAVSSVDGVTPVTLYANPTTHRLLVDLAGGGSGTVQTVAIATANGFAGTSDGNAAAPTLTLTTSITGILKGNGTAISAVTIGSGLSYDGTTLSASGGGSGDVVGPASATDNAVARFDSTTGKLIQNSAVLIADTTGVISGTQGVTFSGATSGTTALVPTAVAGTTTLTLPALTDTIAVLGAGQTFTGANTFSGLNAMLVSSSGLTVRNPANTFSYTITAAAIAANRVLNLPLITGTDTLATLGLAQTFTATQTFGTLVATTINGNTFTTGTYTLTGTAGKTLNFTNTLTLSGTDGTTMTFPTTSKTLAANDGSNWTFTSQAIGDLVYASSATAFTRLAAVATGQVLASAGTGTAPAYTATPLITSIDIGNADTTISRAAAGVIAVEGTILNGYATTATAAGTTALTIASAQTQFFTGSTTQTVTLPTTSVLAGQTYRIVNNSTGNVTVQSSGANTIQILGAGMSAIFTAIVATPTTAANWSFALTSFTGQNIAQTASANAATVNLAYVTNSITNNSAATLTITLPTAGAIDGELRVVRVYDFSAVAQTITWVNTQNSTVTAPVTSNGSTTLPRTIGFQYNSASSLWRCIADA